MVQHFFVGVDGGATKSLIRIEDEAGLVLGQAISGPANIRLSVDQAWQSIHEAFESILQKIGIQPNSQTVFHAGMGLAGCEMTEAYQVFLHRPHPFTTLIVASDANAACLGAHNGQDGAIIIAGTGVVGWQIQAGKITKVGGHGFPHDDEGGGAYLGFEAVKVTLQWLDGRRPVSSLAKRVYAQFFENEGALIQWANEANSTAFATLAPLVIDAAREGDRAAIVLLQQAAVAIDRISLALVGAQIPGSPPLPCAMIGGVAPFLAPYLGGELTSRLRPCLASPEAGAVLLVRHHLQHKDVHAQE